MLHPDGAEAVEVDAASVTASPVLNPDKPSTKASVTPSPALNPDEPSTKAKRC